MDNTTDTTRLREFVADRAGRSRITFGDVRRLQRDYLPGGISTCEEAELLISLDGVVDRADKAWTQWLTEAIVEFALDGNEPADSIETGSRERLKEVLAGAGTKSARRIARGLRRAAGRMERIEPIAPLGPIVQLPARTQNAVAQAVIFDAVGSALNRLALAA